MEKINLSKYRVTWIELTPEYGIVTKHDRKMFGDVILRGRDLKYYKHFANKERALAWIKNFNKKLDKKYSCRLFYDVQFSKSRWENGQQIIPFTQKQLTEVYYL